MTSTTSNQMATTVSDIVATSVDITKTFQIGQDNTNWDDSMVWQWRQFLDGPCGSSIVSTQHIATTPSEFQSPCCPPNSAVGTANNSLMAYGSGGYYYKCPVSEIFKVDGVPIPGCVG